MGQERHYMENQKIFKIDAVKQNLMGYSKTSSQNAGLVVHAHNPTTLEKQRQEDLEFEPRPENLATL